MAHDANIRIGYKRRKTGKQNQNTGSAYFGREFDAYLRFE